MRRPVGAYLVLPWLVACGPTSPSKEDEPLPVPLGRSFVTPIGGGSFRVNVRPRLFFPPGIAIGGDGRVTVAWSTGDEIWATGFDPAAMRWTDSVRLTSSSPVSLSPSCTIFSCSSPGPPLGGVLLLPTRTGIAALWLEASRGAFITDSVGGRWQAATPIPGLQGISYGIAAAVGSDDTLTILGHLYGRGVFYVERRPSGEWRPAELVDPEGGPGLIARFGEGVMATWWSPSGSIARSRDARTGAWSAPTLVAGPTEALVGLVADGPTRVLAVWQDGQGSDAVGLRARRATVSGGWSEPDLVPGRPSAPQVLATGGGAVVAWYELESPPEQGSEIWSVVIGPDGRWGPPGRLQASKNGGAFALRPRVAVGANGAALTSFLVSNNAEPVFSSLPGATASLCLTASGELVAVRSVSGVQVVASDLVVDAAGTVTVAWLESADGYQTLQPMAARLARGTLRGD